VTRWLGVSAGLVPYSFVGYDFEMKQAVPSSIVGGSLESTSFYKGTGGLNQVFVGVGVSPFRNFSVGANLFYNFGTIEHTSTVSFKNTAFKSTEQIKRIEVTDFNTSFGAQYEINFSKERSLALGAVMSLKSELGADAVQTVTTASVDTVSLSFDNKFDLPLCFGMGFVYNLNERLHVGFDYKRQIWSDVRYFGEKEFTDKDKYALGVELLPDGNSKRYLKRVAYRAGFNVSNSYYDVNGNDFKEYVASVGFGLPLKRGLNPTVVNLGFEYGNIGKKSENMIKEQYFKFILNMTINERWFTKRKFE
jgi:long-subunit fatty acid transport protein